MSDNGLLDKVFLYFLSLTTISILIQAIKLLTFIQNIHCFTVISYFSGTFIVLVGFIVSIQYSQVHVCMQIFEREFKGGLKSVDNRVVPTNLLCFTFFSFLLCSFFSSLRFHHICKDFKSPYLLGEECGNISMLC
jgi:hypothetical protein